MATRDAVHRFTIPPPASRPRSPSGPAVRFSRPDPEVAMQVSIRGEWHRPMLDPRGIRYLDPAETACEESLVGTYSARRDESYEGNLCTRGCFTPAELRRAAEYVAAVEKRRADELAKQDAERERWFTENLAKRRTSPGIGPLGPVKPNEED